MKKYLLTLLLCLIGIVSAHAYSDVYLRGDMNGWVVQDAWKFTTTDGVNYTLTNVTITAGKAFKVSDASWGTVNYGGQTNMETDREYELEYGNNTNCTLKAHFTGNVEFNLDSHKIKFVTPSTGGGNQGGSTTTHADVYLRGDMNGWVVQDAWKFTTSDGVNYTLTNVTIPANKTFKVADASWDTVNYGGQTNMAVNTEYELEYNSSDNCSLAADFTGNVEFNLDSHKIKFVTPSSGGGNQGGSTTTHADVYLRGDMNGWVVQDAWKFTTTDGVNYTLTNVTIPANKTFKVGDASWGTVNYGGQANMAVNTEYELEYNSSDNCSLAADFTGNVEFNLDSHKIKFVTTSSGGGTVTPGVAAPSGTLPIIYINVYKTNADGSYQLDGNGNRIFNNVVIDKDLQDKDYRSGEAWLDINGCQWMIDQGFTSVGSADSPLPLEIKARGNYTRTGFSKKPFKLKFGKKQTLLGMTPEKSKHWALLAHADDSYGYLRNYIGFNLGQRIGLPWTPSQQPVEVVINGDYRGLYFLTESIRVGDGRVPIQELKDEETKQELISGGYLVELDNYPEDESSQIYINDDLRVTFNTPEVYSPIQRQFVDSQFRTMENLVKSHSDNLWRYMDLDDAARHYLVMEIMSHTESYHGSTYLFRDRGDLQKWHFSPLWDMGNAFEGPTNQFFYNAPIFSCTWIGDMRQNTKFNEKVKETWKWFMSTQVDGLMDDINAYVEHIRAAAIADHARWGNAELPIQYYDYRGEATKPTPVTDNSNMTARRNDALNHLNGKINWLQSQFGSYATPTAEPARDTTPAEPLADWMQPDYVNPRIYVYNEANWSKINAYIYNSNSDYLVEWPGTSIEKFDDVLVYEHNGHTYEGGLFYMDLPAKYRNGYVIFVNPDNTNQRYPADGFGGMQLKGQNDVIFITGGSSISVVADGEVHVGLPISKTLPVVYITTDNKASIGYGDEGMVTATVSIDVMGHTDWGITAVSATTGVEIKGRDRYAWDNNAKLPYKLKFAKKAEILTGVAKSKHWVLMPYVETRTYGSLLDFTGHELSRAVGLEWTPEMQPVELVLNGEYKGLYFIAENVRTDKNRVNIPASDDNTYNEATDWILEFNTADYANEANHSWTEGDRTYHVISVSPEFSDFASDVEAQTRLAGHLATNVATIREAAQNAFLNRLSDEWTKVIDAESAAKFYVVQELMDCSDAYSANLFMYHTADSTWKMGPVWDFSHSFASEGNKGALLHNLDDYDGVFIHQLEKNLAFRTLVHEYYRQLTGAEVTEEPTGMQARAPRAANKLDDVISNVTDMANRISAAAAVDATTWPQYAADAADPVIGAAAIAANLRQTSDYLANEDHWTSIPTGIENVEADTMGGNDSATYYDLTGRRIDAPAHGTLVIVRRGNTYSKELLK